jgi:PAS domain-containing protein
MPMNMYLGPDLLLFYNEPACAIFGDKHPAALGRPAREIFPEVWDTMGARLEQVMAEGRPLTLEDITIPLDRNGEVRVLPSTSIRPRSCATAKASRSAW